MLMYYLSVELVPVKLSNCKDSSLMWIDSVCERIPKICWRKWSTIKINKTLFLKKWYIPKLMNDKQWNFNKNHNWLITHKIFNRIQREFTCNGDKFIVPNMSKFSFKWLYDYLKCNNSFVCLEVRKSL